MKARRLTTGVMAFAMLAATFGVQFVGGVQAAHGFDPTKFTEEQERLLSEFSSFELSRSTSVDHGSKVPTYFAKSHDDCAARFGDNVKVNQNCLNLSDRDLQGRAQAQNETSIAQDVQNPDHMVASFNDYRRGDGNCYGAYSNDSGKTWSDSTVPMSFTRGGAFGASRQYWQAGGDTSVAYDTKGNAYLSCQVFMRGQPTTANPDLSSAFYVFRSTANNGASWNFPGRPVIESADVQGTGTSDFLDKQLLTVDNHVGSPFQDRIYVSWTTFSSNGTAYIYEAYSNDYGEHFSSPHLVSADSSLCPNNYGIVDPNGNCNENQFSQPFTGPDGKLYIVWANFNNAVNSPDNRNQMLLARSTDGGNTFSTPVKVGDYYDLPDCATYQGGNDPGRACVPEKAPTTHSIFRATNYPVGAVNPANPSQVAITYGSYINPHSNKANGCEPAGTSPDTGQDLYTGVKTRGACNNDILVSVSNNAGAVFTGTSTDPRFMPTATPDAAQATTDQFWQWAAFTKDGKFVTTYYDRQFGDDETTGSSDITVAGSKDLTSWGTKRVTSSSMPPPTEFAGTFYGDYIGMAAWDQAQPIWSDTRPPDLFTCPGTPAPGTPPAVCTAREPSSSAQAGMPANDQDVFTAAAPVPAGHGDGGGKKP